MVKRPFRILVLAIFVVLVSLWNGLRLGETIFFWQTLGSYGAHPIYIALSAAVWLVTGLLLGWALLAGKAWGWTATLIGIVGYNVWYWFDRLVLQKPHANWPFVLAANIIFLVIILTILLSPRTRRYFKRAADERRSQTPTIA